MKTIEPKRNEAPLDMLARCNGYYACPKDESGRRLGPLVGYTARYDGVRQWVGDEYANFARAERHSAVLECVAASLYDKVGDQYKGQILSSSENLFTGFCGAPEGGKALAVALAIEGWKQYLFPGKRVIAIKSASSREIAELAFDRHEPDPGEHWWIVEDVCNNFSTSREMVSLINKFGAVVDGIACFLNRSLEVDRTYTVGEGIILPVVSLVRRPIKQYRQDDPFVAEDVQAGNVAWEPKTEWDHLAEAVATHR